MEKGLIPGTEENDRLMRDLDNLIWIWNGQDRGWSVPAEQFDLASMDIYPRSSIDRSSRVRLFRRCQSLAPTKMVALSECEFIPDPDLLIQNQANWLWYMTWHTNYLYASNGEDGKPLPGKSFSLNEAYINQADLQRIMDHDYVLTLDELPDEIKSSDELPDEVKPSAD